MECEKSCGCIIIEDGKVLMVKQIKYDKICQNFIFY